MKKVFETILKLNFRSIYLNLKLFPIRKALKFPLLISSRVLIKSLKGKITIEGNFSCGMVQIGYGKVGIFDYKRSRGVLDVTGELIFKGKTRIGHGSKIVVGREGKLILGNNFLINAESSIIANKLIKFGDNVLISWDVLFMDDDFHQIIDINKNTQINTPKDIIIGDRIWFGAKVLVLNNTYISGNVVIAAGTILKGKFEKEGVIYGGNPARVLREDITWEL